MQELFLSYRSLYILILFTLHGLDAKANDRVVGSLGLITFTHTEGIDETGNLGLGVEDNSSSILSKHKREYTFLTANLCYVKNDICFGAKYLTGTLKYTMRTSNSSQSGSSNMNYEAFGLSLGFYGDNLFVTASYLIQGKKGLERTLASSQGVEATTTSSYGMSGSTSIDIGYGFSFGRLKIGPLLSLVHFEYDKRVDPTGQEETLNPKESDDYIMPHFALWVDI